MGEDDDPADILFESAHGRHGNIYEYDLEVLHPLFGYYVIATFYDIYRPGHPPLPIPHPYYDEPPTIESTNWTDDIEWAILYSCMVFGRNSQRWGYDPVEWTTYWDDALLRLSSQNNCHGILASSDELVIAGGPPTDCVPPYTMKDHVDAFCDEIKGNNNTIIDAWMNTAADCDQWAAAALFHNDNLSDKLNYVTPDTDDTIMYYTWFAYYNYNQYDDSWEATSAGDRASDLVDLGDKQVRIVCHIPTQQPKLANLKVRKESLPNESFDHRGFDKIRLDNKGRVKFTKAGKDKPSGPIALTKDQSVQKAIGFIKAKGGGLPADASIAYVTEQMVQIFDAKTPTTIQEKYVKKRVLEYGHKFNGIQIVGGNRGDRISVEIEDDQIIGFKRHWRKIVGPDGNDQQVISAREALDVAVNNLPAFVLFPEEYEITTIQLFYYGLPSEKKDQVLTPAWGFEVNKAAWVYVNAFTAEAIK